jgi:hypothetical protein
MNTYRQVYCFDCGLLMSAKGAYKRHVCVGSSNGIDLNPEDYDDVTYDSRDYTRLEYLCPACTNKHDKQQSGAITFYVIAVLLGFAGFATFVAFFGK